MQEFILPEHTVLSSNDSVRFEQYEWNDVMALLSQSETSVVVGAHTIRVNRLKYQTFVRDYFEGQFCCSACGLQPTHAAVFGSAQSEDKFINFFGLQNSHEILLTHDHTLARALGGENNLSNTTTMCVDCNGQKSVFESIYGNHRFDIIKNYLNNSLGGSVSLSKLDHMIKNFDISSINPKFLSGSMYLLFVFNNEATFDNAINLLAQQLDMTDKQYIKHCNTMGAVHMKSFPPTVFPFARIFYPKLSAFGAQYLRLEISKNLQITWPNVLQTKPVENFYYDEILQSILIDDHPGLGKIFKASDLQNFLKANPEFTNKNVLHFGTTPVDFSSEARKCLRSEIDDPDLMIAVRKNIRRTLVPGHVIDKKFSPSSWDQLSNTTITVAPSLVRSEPRLKIFDGLTPAQVKDHPTYSELLVELVCFKQQKDIHGLVKHTKSKVDLELLKLLRTHQPQLSPKASEAVAACAWSVDEFFFQWQRKTDAESRLQSKRDKKNATSKLKRHFARNDDGFKTHSKRKRSMN